MFLYLPKSMKCFKIGLLTAISPLTMVPVGLGFKTGSYGPQVMDSDKQWVGRIAHQGLSPCEPVASGQDD